MQTMGKTVIGRPITAEELELEIAHFQATYRLTNAEFLARFDDPADSMEDIEDAGLWHIAIVALFTAGDDAESSHHPPPWADDLTEERGPVRALVLL